MAKQNLDKTKAVARIKKLRKLIDRYRYEYHVLDKPSVSDAVNDSLKHELQELEDQFPDLVTSDSPTQRVGGEPLDKFKKVTHKSRMLSLTDTFSFKELKDWVERDERQLGVSELRTDYFTELKMDGLAVSLTYRQGDLAIGATRGDGTTGEEVTGNLKTIEAIPLHLRRDSKYYRQAIGVELVVRGEVYMEKSAFGRVNREQKKGGEALFANPRNAAAGSVRQLNPKITALRELSFVAWSLETNLGQKFHHQEHEILKDLGFRVLKENKLCKSLNKVERFKQSIEKKRDKLDFQIDGIVVVVDNDKLFDRLGVVGKAPRGQIAYKFAPEQATTVVRDIIVQVGRTGKLTPVAVFEPTLVAGSTISRATLHNEDELNKKDIRIGDTVVIQKAGDVIPEVVSVIKKLRPENAKKFIFPIKCPICGSKVIRVKGEAAHRCTNKNCFAQQKRQIQHFVSKGGMDIEGLGPKILEQLIKEGLIKHEGDLYKITEDDLRPLERFAEKSAENLVESIKESRRIPLGRFIYALGILNVGEETAYDLALRFSSLEKIGKADLEDLERVHDIGSVVAKSIYNYFRDRRNLDKINDLLKSGVQVESQKQTKSKIKGLSFVITGGLENYSREEAKQAIRDRGGEVHETVTKDTNYVVVGSDPGSKYDRAKKLGSKIINEEQFKNLLK